MKTLILILIFLSSLLLATELEWVDEQIEAIKPSRKGIEISNIMDPFIFLEKNRPEVKKDTAAASTLKPLVKSSSDKIKTDDNGTKKIDFNLAAIVNTSAMIDGNWRRINDKLDGNYTIVDISKNTVTLKKGDKERILSTYSKTPTIKFKNK
ncbi:MAG: hypothetical protein A2540_08245 [Sulfurimonas sp. RIFOXYD2_FULL_37_8]|nr:MAG: hypothetical protein A2540_08245 [Sulfurimonas sp. RIFOXYD2_FULL_37_8]